MSPRTRWIVALGLGFVSLAGGCSERKTDDTDIQFVDLTQLRMLMDEDRANPDRLILIDPRLRADFETAHLPGAINLRLPELERNTGRDPAISLHEHIVVYGDDPGSAIARGVTKKLMSRRYKRVRMFAGGVKAWKDAGLPVETGAP